MTLSPALMSSAKPDWRTPPEVLEPLRAAFGEIGLDPCAHPEGDEVKAARRYVLPLDDGLALPWDGYGTTFCNPPYSRALKPWSKKIAHEAARGVEIVALVPARPDTGWWGTLVGVASAVLFVRGRLTFLGAPGPAPFPSACVYLGARWARFLAAYEGLGWGVRP
jgi:phage N-6-adenine-methyltransferase